MIWKSCKCLGFPDYEVREDGEVRNVLTKKTIAFDYNVKGYYRIRLCKNGFEKRFLVHRLVALLYCPNPLLKPIVNHDDEDIHNNYWRNLRWMTSSENVRYSIEYKRKELQDGVPF